MKPSREFLSLPIISLREGQKVGYVKNLIINPEKKAVAALVIDPRGFFRDQRIIPYNRVVSVGNDAITIDKESQVEKSSNLPEILNLIKDKLSIIGTKVMTENGKILGIAQEYYIDPATGEITDIELSGGKIEGFFSGKALLSAKFVITIGHDVIIAEKESEGNLIVAKQGLNVTMRSFLYSTSHKASEGVHSFSRWVKRKAAKKESKTDAPATAENTEALLGDDSSMAPGDLLTAPFEAAFSKSQPEEQERTDLSVEVAAEPVPQDQQTKA